MTKYIPMWAFALGFLGLLSCSDSGEIETPPIVNKVTLDDTVNSFVWQGMNSWYNWQTESVNLSDNKDDDLEEYYTFLNGYTDYEDLMFDLCYKHYSVVGSENAVDRFSWFIEDYVVQEQSFQGINTVFGFRYQSVQINEAGDIVFYLSFVEPNSPAADAGFKRGNIVNGLNGTQFTKANFNSTMAGIGSDSATFSFISVDDNGVITQLNDKTISRAVVASNPVFLKKVFDNIGDKKVGYLVYNQFSGSFNDELNEAFGFFKSEGIDELILDLRFNGGGSVLTSAYLASMIYGNAQTGVFAELNFNAKHTEQNGAYNFEDEMAVFNTEGNFQRDENINRLTTIDKLYVLISGSTASASEMIINGLKPYMSSVKLVGATTYGKNVGSITLYDAPSSDYTNKGDANGNHKFAMQPIVFQIFNKNGESDYIQGFVPDTEVKEWNYWNNILPLGDENEALLKVALDDIRGVASKRKLTKLQKQAKVVDYKYVENKFEKEMYIDTHFFNNN